jgi:hypothetical protein
MNVIIQSDSIIDAIINGATLLHRYQDRIMARAEEIAAECRKHLPDKVKSAVDRDALRNGWPAYFSGIEIGAYDDDVRIKFTYKFPRNLEPEVIYDFALASDYYEQSFVDREIAQLKLFNLKGSS